MPATKIGENTTSILNYYFSFQVYTSIHQTNYLVMENKFTSYKQYSFFLIFSGNLKKSHTDHIYYKFNKCFFTFLFLDIFFHKILSIKSCSCTLETSDLRSVLKFSPPQKEYSANTRMKRSKVKLSYSSQSEILILLNFPYYFIFWCSNTAWKVSKYEVISGPYAVQFFLYKWNVLKKIKTSLEACFLSGKIIFTFSSSVCKVRTKSQST